MEKLSYINEAIYVNQAAFIICALLGGFTHYLKKYLKKETDVGLFDWYGRANLASTLYTIIIFIFTMIGALAGGIINEHTGFWACLYTGFVTGFAIDAGFNSDKKISDALKDARSEARFFKEAVNEDLAEAEKRRSEEPPPPPKEPEKPIALAEELPKPPKEL